MTLAIDQHLDVQPVIQVRDLSAIFSNGNGGLHVLDHISFDIWPRQFVCILGPSGSGKSTLLRILAGLLQATSGDVLMDGEPILVPRHGIGFVFQKANLMPWRTVLDNITLPLEIMNKSRAVQLQQAQEMVELVGLQGFENCTLP